MRRILKRRSPFAPDELFGLVADVERYPDFIPWITALTVDSRRTNADGTVAMEATARVGVSVFQGEFTTAVRLDPGRLRIDVDLVRGPLRRLTSCWRFSSLEEESDLTFEIDLELSSKILERLLAANFESACQRLVALFEARAQALLAPTGSRREGPG